MKKIVSNYDAAQPTQTQLPDSGPEVPALRLVPGGGETPDLSNLSDTELCSYIESEYAPHKKSLKANAPYFAEAKKRFSQQGRRIPVPGRPTYEEWLEKLELNPRSIRRVVAEYEAALGKTDKIEPEAKSDNAKGNAAMGKKTPGSDKGSDGKRNMTRGTTCPTTRALQQLMKSWSRAFSGLGKNDRSTQLVDFVESLSTEDRADLFDALHITMNPAPEPPVASCGRKPDVSAAIPVEHVRQGEPTSTIHVTAGGSQKTWSADTTTAASATLPPNPKAKAVPKDSSLRSLVREVDKEELDRQRSWNQ